jgi:hypothetical protein
VICGTAAEISYRILEKVEEEARRRKRKKRKITL